MAHVQRRRGGIALLTCAVLALPAPLAFARATPDEPPAPVETAAEAPEEPSSRSTAPSTKRGPRPRPGLEGREGREERGKPGGRREAHRAPGTAPGSAPGAAPESARKGRDGRNGRLAGNPAGVGRRPGRTHPTGEPGRIPVPPDLDPLPTTTAPGDPGHGTTPGEPTTRPTLKPKPGDGNGHGNGHGRDPDHDHDHGDRPPEDSDRPGGRQDGRDGHDGRESPEEPYEPAPQRPSQPSGDDGDGGRDGSGSGDGSRTDGAGEEGAYGHDGRRPGRPGRKAEPPAPVAPAPPSPSRPAPDSSDQAVGKHDLYEPDIPSPSREAGRLPGQGLASEPSGEILPVLPLGAGMALIGLGLAFLALRLRRG